MNWDTDKWKHEHLSELSANDDEDMTASREAFFLLFEYLKQTGIGPVEFKKYHSRDLSVLHGPEERFPTEWLDEVWITAIEMTRDPMLGIHFAGWIDSNMNGHLLKSLITTSPTFLEAVRMFVRYHVLFHDQQNFKTTLESGNDQIAIRVEIDNDQDSRLHQQHIESVFYIWTLICRYFTNRNPYPDKVYFTHKPGTEIKKYRAVFHCDVQFEKQSNIIIFPENLANKPNKFVNPQVLETLEDFAQKLIKSQKPGSAFSRKVKKVILQSFEKQKYSLESISTEMAMSSRKVQKQLQMEKNSFQQILDEVRCDLARQYLQKTDDDITDVAFMLGYSTQSTFTRAFKKWTGNSPLQYRLQKQTGTS